MSPWLCAGLKGRAGDIQFSVVLLSARLEYAPSDHAIALGAVVALIFAGIEKHRNQAQENADHAQAAGNKSGARAALSHHDAVA